MIVGVFCQSDFFVSPAIINIVIGEGPIASVSFTTPNFSDVNPQDCAQSWQTGARNPIVTLSPQITYHF
jgi:hypothetical protein